MKARPSGPALRGLYLITAGGLAARAGLEQAVAAAIRGGARLVQYRDKSDEQTRRQREAAALTALCRRHGVVFLVNDDIALAAAVGAHGVHLGRDDATVAAARSALGADAIIGVSCYNELGRARAAQAAGASYVAFGSFFASPTKPQAVRADIALLRRARRDLELPVVAIGGITPENGRALVGAGADMLAVISGVLGTADVTATARAFADLFDHPEDIPS